MSKNAAKYIGGNLLGSPFVSSIASQDAAKAEKKEREEAAAEADRKAKELEQKAIDAEQNAKLEAEEKARKSLASQTQSVLTSPLGVSSEAPTKKPTLLGVS